jgi:hypothetical protein
LALDKPITPSEFDLISKLKNLCIKIPFLQAIKEIPIYTKTIRELCIKKPGRRKKDPPTIQVIGRLEILMSTEIIAKQYVDLGHPVVAIFINKTPIANTLVNLDATINLMTLHTLN